MNNKLFLNCLLTITILLCALTTVRAQANENVVLRWNRVLQQTLSTPGQHPATIFQTRPYAMMYAAIFDAVNSIDDSYTPYLTTVHHNNRRASQEAAAAKAAHDVLSTRPKVLQDFVFLQSPAFRLPTASEARRLHKLKFGL